MRSILALLAALVAPFCTLAQTVPFPPSPKVLIAVNPVTNKVYVANEFANTVTVLNNASNTTTTIPVGNRPQFIAVNPITNRVYVNNGGDASLTVIDGATDTNLTPTALPVGSQGPMAVNVETNMVYIVRMTSVATDEVTYFNAANNTWYTIATESFQPTALAVNPVTNTLYIAHYGTGDVRVISAADSGNAHPATVSIPAWSHPFAIAANSATNKVYVLTEDSRGPIGIINGADNSSTFPLPASGHAVGPKALAVNPVTNKVYAAFSNEVIVIDGATNAYTYIPVSTGTGAASIAVNHRTNTIYVSSDSGTLTVIDGATNAKDTLTIPAGTISLGTNPVTNEVFCAGGTIDIVPGAAGTPASPQPATTITPLASNASGANGALTLNAGNTSPNPLPVRGVFFQFDTLEGAWKQATGTGPYTATFTGLSAGSHTIQAFAVEGHVASTDTGPQSNPLLGGLVSYSFTVGAGPAKARLTDLDGDGHSDLLYRNFATGQVFRLLMNGLSVRNGALAYSEPNLAWRVVADADFNGDGVTDLLWRNDSTGQVYMQFFTASGMPGNGAFIWTEPNAAWQIVATPDFDGDGKADILWWNSVTGQTYAMQMDGTTIVAQGGFFTQPDTRWSVAAVGDFAGSGKRNQILWHDASTGEVLLMTVTLSGGTFGQTAQPVYRSSSTAWKIVAAADFNGDGKSDILWRNDATGQVYMLLMNGPAIATEGMVYQEPNTAWKIVSVGDYDGDGRSDLLWRNDSTGAVYMMLMNGLTIGSQAMVYNEPNTAWHVLGPWEYAQ